jgi:hypothetical protein
MADSDRKPGSFTVTDRRGFDASGAAKDNPAPPAEKPPAQAPSDPASEPAPKTASTTGAAKTVEQRRAEREAARSLPPADFATLVLSLGSSAVAYLGEEPGLEGAEPTRNLPMAKHAIDLLSVLEEKTKGNLTSEEQQIIENLLFDLRIRYVEAIKPSSATGSTSTG